MSVENISKQKKAHKNIKCQVNPFVDGVMYKRKNNTPYKQSFYVNI